MATCNKHRQVKKTQDETAKPACHQLEGLRPKWRDMLAVAHRDSDPVPCCRAALSCTWSHSVWDSMGRWFLATGRRSRAARSTNQRLKNLDLLYSSFQRPFQGHIAPWMSNRACKFMLSIWTGASLSQKIETWMRFKIREMREREAIKDRARRFSTDFHPPCHILQVALVRFHASVDWLFCEADMEPKYLARAKRLRLGHVYAHSTHFYSGIYNVYKL